MRALAAFALVAAAGCARGAGEQPAVVILPAAQASSERAPSTSVSAPSPRAPAAPGARLIAECKALIEIINRGVAAVEKMPSSNDPTGVRDLVRMAERLEAVARELDAVSTTIPALRALAEDYRAMARATAAAERALAGAVTRKDARARAAAESDLEAAVKKEDPLVEQINRICQDAQ